MLLESNFRIFFFLGQTKNECVKQSDVSVSQPPATRQKDNNEQII